MTLILINKVHIRDNYKEPIDGEFVSYCTWIYLVVPDIVEFTKKDHLPYGVKAG